MLDPPPATGIKVDMKVSQDHAGLPWLVADVGGTNARFGWVDDESGAPAHVRVLPVAAHASPGAAAQAYLAALASEFGGRPPRPRRACWALASVIEDDPIELTNAAWRFSRRELAQDLGVEQLRLLNDFEALALALPRLGPQQFRPWGDRPRGQGTLALVGPGTGLGVAALVTTPAGPQALASEGGHATLAATDDDEARVLQEARRHLPHVSAERLLSGIGLPLLHRCLRTTRGLPDVPLQAPQIIERGTTGADDACRHTLELFCALLGGFAGNVALTYGARGGLYIGGGIVPRLGEFFFQSRFRQKFEAKGRFSSYLSTIPTALITETTAALLGAAAALEAQMASWKTP